MSNSQITEKTLEVKIRPYPNQNNQERPDQKGTSRVYLSREALVDLRLESGQSCYLWKTEDGPDTSREAIAWPTLEKSLKKGVVQVSKTFQDACGYKLGDDLTIRAGGSLDVAESINLREITQNENFPELNEADRPHWEWLLEDHLRMLNFQYLGCKIRTALLYIPWLLMIIYISRKLSCSLILRQGQN